MEYSTDSVKPLVTESSVPHTGIADLDPSMAYTYKSNGNYNAFQAQLNKNARRAILSLRYRF